MCSFAMGGQAQQAGSNAGTNAFNGPQGTGFGNNQGVNNQGLGQNNGLNTGQTPLVQVLNLLLQLVQQLGSVAENQSSQNSAGGCPAGGAGNNQAQQDVQNFFNTLGQSLSISAYNTGSRFGLQ